MASFLYRFSWDLAKASANRDKHGVTFELAATVLQDPLARSRYDDEHGRDEERWLTLGQAADRRLLVVCHTFDELTVNEATIRLISAREATPAERRQYENG